MQYWDDQYREGDTPWDTGHACGELIRAASKYCVKPCRVIELGCGTGANAVFLSKCGFQCTAVDVSIEALQKAVVRADKSQVLVNFRLANVLDWPKDLDQPFDFVFDRDCYRFVRMHDVEGYVATLRRITRPGSQFLLLTGSSEADAKHSQSSDERTEPPKVSKDEIRSELGALFQFNWIRSFHFDDRDRRPGPSGWSCLMTRVESRH